MTYGWYEGELTDSGTLPAMYMGIALNDFTQKFPYATLNEDKNWSREAFTAAEEGMYSSNG
ncbi:hypothetical protein NBZ79_14865 [Sneathiella marina]|uniref:Uncharacterized protein n=1 Tax=Sneathiella marina TaxID=2950108 RepID=A0ABY4W0Q8_9PROT|nr:hypothetical protein [Sneathiella marina]USG60451.1 hypothetical protein NBZ79_14865 [Sneathiella marina]